MNVRVDRRGPIVIVTIDRPAKRNAINAAVTDTLDDALNAFEDDDSAAVGIITGGPHVFSAGTDLDSGAGQPTERGGPYGVTRRAMNKPVIAAVEGVAAGGGFEVVLACTLVVASSEASFSLPEVRLGLVAECGGLFRASRALPLNIAREMLLTGAPLAAARAYELGLVNRLATPGRVLGSAVELAEDIARNAPLAVRETLHALEEAHARDDDAAWSTTEVARGSVRASDDAREGVRAFKQRRTPQWKVHDGK